MNIACLVVGGVEADADGCWEAATMIKRARTRSTLLLIKFLSIIAVVFVWQLAVSCAEGGGTGFIEQYVDDGGAAVPETGPTTPTGFCGDGVVNVDGEQCDGTDLDGMTCGQLGMGTGQLSCYPANCTYDTSMCVEDTAAGAGGSYGGGGSGGGV
jgi:hypothetical protein